MDSSDYSSIRKKEVDPKKNGNDPTSPLPFPEYDVCPECKPKKCKIEIVYKDVVECLCCGHIWARLE